MICIPFLSYMSIIPSDLVCLKRDIYIHSLVGDGEKDFLKNIKCFSCGAANALRRVPPYGITFCCSVIVHVSSRSPWILTAPNFFDEISSNNIRENSNWVCWMIRNDLIQFAEWMTSPFTLGGGDGVCQKSRVALSFFKCYGRQRTPLPFAKKKSFEF